MTAHYVFLNECVQPVTRKVDKFSMFSVLAQIVSKLQYVNDNRYNIASSIFDIGPRHSQVLCECM